MKEKINAIAILGGDLKKENGKWRTTTFNKHNNFESLGSRLRVIAGYELYAHSRGADPKLIFIASGGKGANKNYPLLSRIIKKELIELGISQNKIIRESKSNNTKEQLKSLAGIIISKNIGKLAIISNKYHLPRIRAMITYSKELGCLYELLLSHKLVLAPAENILLKCGGWQWKKSIEDAYKSESMKSRIKLEKRGVADVKRGSYKK